MSESPFRSSCSYRGAESDRLALSAASEADVGLCAFPLLHCEATPSSSSVAVESEVLMPVDLLLLDLFSGAVREFLVYSPC
jgi:hypothetical protein